MKYLTFITGLPGVKTHTVLRSLYNNDTLIYKENDNPERERLFQAFPKHVTYMTEDNIHIPNLFDKAARKRRKLGLTWHEYYTWADKELYDIYNKYGKQILMVSHTPSDIIRRKYPDSTIYYIDVDDNNARGCVNRMYDFNKLYWGGGMSSKNTFGGYFSYWIGLNLRFRASREYADHIINWRDIE